MSATRFAPCIIVGILAFSVVADPGTVARPESEPPELKPNGFLTKIDSDNDEILKLANGAVVEVTSGYLGYVGYRKKVLVYRSSGTCKIWVEGKRVFRCDVLREPEHGRLVVVEELSISAVGADGKILTADDGRVFQVSSLFTYVTSIWLAPFDAVLVDGLQLVNLDGSDEPIEVTSLR